MEYELKATTENGPVITAHGTMYEAERELSRMLKAGLLIHGTEVHITTPYKDGKATRTRYQVNNHFGFPSLAILPSAVLTEA